MKNIWFMNIKEICQSVWAAVAAIGTMENSEFPYVSFPKYVR
jgi:hypothetical protein